MFEERVLPQRMENSQNNSNYQTRQRGQSGPLQVPSNKLAKYRGKVLEKVLINRIMQYIYTKLNTQMTANTDLLLKRAR
jgi:hypothetical protein